MTNEKKGAQLTTEAPSNTAQERVDASSTPRRLQETTRAHSTTFLDLRKTDGEHLRIEVREQRGHTFIDLRNWYLGADGQWRPSDKGVTIRAHQVPEIVRGLTVAATAINPNGGV